MPEDKSNKQQNKLFIFFIENQNFHRYEKHVSAQLWLAVR